VASSTIVTLCQNCNIILEVVNIWDSNLVKAKLKKSFRSSLDWCEVIGGLFGAEC